MRNIKKLLVLVLLTFTVFACNKSDDSNEDQGSDFATLIVGSWRFISSSTNGTPDQNNNPCASQTRVVFTSNGNVTISEYSGVNCETITGGSGTYVIGDSDLTLTIDQESTTVEITTLNTTDMSIRYIDEGDVIVETYAK